MDIDTIVSRRSMLKGGAAAFLALGASTTNIFAQDAPRRGGTLRIIHYQNASSLDPHTGISGADYQINYALYDRLFDFDPQTLEARPMLAEAWEFTSPQTLVLKLRSGVRFHDGTVLDAEAVKFNLERTVSHPRSNIKPDVAAIERVEVSGDHEVTIHMNAPDASLVLSLTDRAGMMVSPSAAQAAGDNFDRNPVGCGQYKFVEWIDNSSITLVRHDDYWQEGLPHLDGLVYRIVPDLTTGVRSLIADEGDIVLRIPMQQLRSIEQRPELRVVDAPTIQLSLIYLHFGKPPFDDVRVRQALNHAIDRTSYSQIATGGSGEVAWSLLPKLHWAHAKDVVDTYPYDPDRARWLMADAGHKEIDVELHCWSDQLSQQKAEVLLEQLRQVGINVRLLPGSIADAASKFFSANIGNGFISRWSNRPDPCLGFFYLFGTGGFFNASRMATPAVDEALQRTRTVYDRAERLAALDGAARIISDQALTVPLIFERDLSAYHERVQEYESNLQAKHRFDKVWLKT